jgi:hypothetical protein
MDFKELPVNGQAFEQLVRELLFSLGLHVEWSGRGPDGGRDLLCRETLVGRFASQTRTWLVQCKHKAHSGDSVGVGDLDDIVSSCIQHSATGYILVCSTQPSSGVVNRLEGISNNAQNNISAVYWDGVMIQRLLSQPRQWAIAQRFMPLSCGEWQVYATEAPNDFVAHYKGYVFHLTNRIGSTVGHHLPSISARISDLENIKLPEGHFIRPRAVHFDDKNGGYRWYIDYMRPHNEPIFVSRARFLEILKDGWVLDDGQIYSWDINFVKYFGSSDHYDRDHYDYYTRYLPNYLGGSSRESDSDHQEYWATYQEAEALEAEHKDKSKLSFELMTESFRKVPYLRVVRAINCNPEALPRFERRFDWSDLANELDVDTDNILISTLVFDVLDLNAFLTLLSKLPNGVGRHFRAARVYVFLPDEGLDTEPDEYLFDVRFSLHPTLLTDLRSARSEFNSYFNEIRTAVEQEVDGDS